MSQFTSPASSTEPSPTPSEASSTESSPTSLQASPTPSASTTVQKKKLKKKVQEIADLTFVQKLRNATAKDKNENNIIEIWNEATPEQRRRVINKKYLKDEELSIIRQDRTDLGNFIEKLNSLNENMRNEIEDVFKNEYTTTDTTNNPEKLKKAWKKHKPFIVRSKGKVMDKDNHQEIKVRKCALNFGAHRCVYHFLPFDKKKIFEPKVVIEPAVKSEEVEEVKANEAANSAAESPAEIPVESPQVQPNPPKKNTDNTKKEKKNKESITSKLKQCKQYTKVVGIDLDFYRYADPDSLVAKTIEAAIESKNIIDTKGRQYFCDKHLKQLVGLVPRQIDGDSLAYHLIATQPFYEGDYVATFSQIKVSNDVDLQDELRISPVSYFKSTLDTNDKKKIGTLDDTCFKDLGDYITDPNADNVFEIYVYKKDQQITEEDWENSFKCFESKCNVEIELKKETEENEIKNKIKNKICLKATRTIYKNEIIYLNFGIEYWKNYLKFNAKKKNMNQP